MATSLTRRLAGAWRALSGMEEKAVPAAEPGGPEAALAKARLELEEAKAERERLREEYARRERLAGEEKAGAGREAVLRLAKRVGPLLSQLATLRAMAAEGKPVRAEDLLTLAGKLEKAFAEGGLQPVGEVGATAAFDPKFHQRMSGGDVSDGDAVRVRFVGYACGDAVVTKAMVSREESGK
jgi:molecular chaperone GrpE (heat shock protein)